MTNSVDLDQTASILNSSVMLGNYLQQMTFSDTFLLGALRVKSSPVGKGIQRKISDVMSGP